MVQLAVAAPALKTNRHSSTLTVPNYVNALHVAIQSSNFEGQTHIVWLS
jgi:hypothetical protein